jgi:hypothetical protein
VFSGTVKIDGYDFAVTANLKDALMTLAGRAKQTNSYFWIDAICINQHDSAERSFPVQMMSYIYQQSDHILAWLGKPEDETDGAMAIKQIREVGSCRRQVQ